MSSLTILHHAVETDYSYSFLVFLNALSSALEFNYLDAKAEVCWARLVIIARRGSDTQVSKDSRMC